MCQSAILTAQPSAAGKLTRTIHDGSYQITHKPASAGTAWRIEGQLRVSMAFHHLEPE
jgi:hypothetical protein